MQIKYKILKATSIDLCKTSVNSIIQYIMLPGTIISFACFKGKNVFLIVDPKVNPVNKRAIRSSLLMY